MKSQTKRILIILLSLFAVILISANFGVNKHVIYSEPYVDVSIEETKEYNSTYTVEDAQITYESATKNASSYVVLPNGEITNSKSILLSSYGVYKVVYYADFGGEEIKVEKSFTVKMPYFELNKKTDKCEFVEIDKEKYSLPAESSLSGVMLNLTESDTATLTEVIDFSTLKSTKPFVEFYVLPTNPGVKTKNTLSAEYLENHDKPADYFKDYKMGTADFGKITFTLTDVYDENNYINIIVLNADNWFCYVLTSSRDNQLSGWLYNGEQEPRLMTNGRFGTGIRLSFTNIHYSSDPFGADWSKCANRLYFDYSEKALYVQTTTEYFKVLDYDNSAEVSELWEGFSTGRAKLTVSCGQFSSGNYANLLFTVLNGKQVVSNEVVDEINPELSIEYGNYQKSALPFALVNHKYPLLNYIAKDSNNLGVIEEITVKNSNGENVEIVDGAFVPTSNGEYTIRYKLSDYFGNSVHEELVVTAKNELDEIKIGLSDVKDLTVPQGSKVIIPNVSSMGGSGNISTEYYVLYNSQKIDVANGEFIAEKKGEYLVEYLLTDYIGQKYAFHFVVNVVESDVPVFIDDVVLPKYFIAGKQYLLPTLSAYKYSNSNVEEINASIYVADGLAERKISNNLYLVDNTSGTNFATIKYKATSNNVDAEPKTYIVPIIDVSNDGLNNADADAPINLSKLFIGNNIIKSLDDSCLNIKSTTASGNVDFEFINSISTDRMEIIFSVNNKPLFEAIDIYLTDSVYADKFIKISFYASKNKTEFAVNDGARYNLATKMVEGRYITISLRDENGVITTDSGLVNVFFNKYFNGEEYNGFSNRSAYVSFSLQNISKNAEVNIHSINGQNFDSEWTYDNVEPKISTIESKTYLFLPGQDVIIGKMVAYDIIDTYFTHNVSVYKMTNFEYVSDNNGLKLQRVSADKEYVLSNLPTGRYLVEYEAVSSDGESFTDSYVFNVNDIEAPVITVSENIATSKVLGSTLTLPKATVNDNVDGAILTYKIMVYTPTGRYESVKDSKYLFTEKGVFKFVYYVYDEAGNMGTFTHFVEVK